MTKKEEKAKQRMCDSQIDAIRRLRWIREMNGLTQEDVAKKMGITNFYVSRIENGKIVLRMSTLRRYALACGGEIIFRAS